VVDPPGARVRPFPPRQHLTFCDGPAEIGTHASPVVPAVYGWVNVGFNCVRICWKAMLRLSALSERSKLADTGTFQAKWNVFPPQRNTLLLLSGAQFLSSSSWRGVIRVIEDSSPYDQTL
jgi:hypothetical protein